MAGWCSFNFNLRAPSRDAWQVALSARPEQLHVVLLGPLLTGSQERLVPISSEGIADQHAPVVCHAQAELGALAADTQKH